MKTFSIGVWPLEDFFYIFPIMIKIICWPYRIKIPKKYITKWNLRKKLHSIKKNCECKEFYDLITIHEKKNCLCIQNYIERYTETYILDKVTNLLGDSYGLVIKIKTDIKKSFFFRIEQRVWFLQVFFCIFFAKFNFIFGEIEESSGLWREIFMVGCVSVI